MIELIMVIVILGIVSSIGSEIIANTYTNYLLQRATHRASLKTELAAQQIANLLSYRIPGTTLARNPANLSDNRLVSDPTDANDTTHTLLEWIGADNDGFSAALLPPWNGFCDVAASDQNKIITPGSKLRKASTIFSNLANGAVHPAIFFRKHDINKWVYSYDKTTVTTKYIEALKANNAPGCLGMVSSDASCVSTVEIKNNEKLRFYNTTSTSNPHKVISEHYKLAWTAYAVRPVDNANGLFDLWLYYNYRPWEGTRLTTAGYTTIPHATIITNVSVFKFAESGNTLRFKICAQENIGEDYNITICKEKAVSL